MTISTIATKAILHSDHASSGHEEIANLKVWITVTCEVSVKFYFLRWCPSRSILGLCTIFFRGQKEHINFLDTNFLVPSQNTPQKKFVCLISWAMRQGRDPHKHFLWELWVKRGGPKRAMLGLKTSSLSFCFLPLILQDGSGTKPEPETWTVRTAFQKPFSRNRNRTGTAGTIIQEPHFCRYCTEIPSIFLHHVINWKTVI